jgi:hypothetical protein
VISNLTEGISAPSKHLSHSEALLLFPVLHFERDVSRSSYFSAAFEDVRGVKTVTTKDIAMNNVNRFTS